MLHDFRKNFEAEETKKKIQKLQNVPAEMLKNLSYK
jgi:hypothetical protein